MAITHFIALTGYPGVLLLMALESACIPIPSEAIMPFAGSLIVTDPARAFSLPVLALVGATGNLAGSCVAYWVGALGGRPFLEKYGKYLLIRRKDLNNSERFFNRFGEWTALLSRLLPVVRTFISLPAGISRMNFPKFCIFTFVGALPFCYLLAWWGQWLGKNWQTVRLWLHKADLGIVAVLVVIFLIWLWHHLKPDDVLTTN